MISYDQVLETIEKSPTEVDFSQYLNELTPQSELTLAKYLSMNETKISSDLLKMLREKNPTLYDKNEEHLNTLNNIIKQKKVLALYHEILKMPRSEYFQMKASVETCFEIIKVLQRTIAQRVTIMTYNIYMTKCSNSQSNIADFLNEYVPPIDIVCTQEDKHLDLITNLYEGILNCGVGTHEKVQMYVKKDFNKHVVNTKCIEEVGRYALVTRLNCAQNFKIASLHLAGGRNFDRHVFKITNILTQKLKLLKSVLEENPAIICGDFNSVYSNNDDRLKKFLESQYEYFKNNNDGVLTNEQIETTIRDLNMEPYRILIENGYKYASPQNDLTTVTNGRGKTTVDCFWYDPKRVVVRECKIIDKGGGTDWKEIECVNFQITILCCSHVI